MGGNQNNMQPEVYPWKITIDPPQVPPGEETRVTIELNQTTLTPLVLTLSSLPGNAFADLPQTVTVPSGADEYSLILTVSNSQSGAVLFTAASQYGEAAGGFVVPGTTASLQMAA